MGDRGPQPFPHPSRGHYIRGCRCEGCKAANNDYQKRYRDRMKRNGWTYLHGYKVPRGY